MSASTTRLVGLTKSFGDTEVLRELSLDIEDGEFVAIVGPSGCGKSTLLRLIAGLDSPTSGDIWFGDERVTRRPPYARNIGMVFQNYALYPHLTVRQNLLFGLEAQRTPKAEMAARVEEVARLLELGKHLGRKPKALSGGQRQRVALGRALIRRPRLFLMDEPLSNLDAQLRERMRVDIRRLHEEVGVTTLYVTHDQTEAMTMADRIVVLNAGRIEQVGTPEELYRRPATRFVARFIGAPAMNLVKVAITATADGWRLAESAGGELGAALELPSSPIWDGILGGRSRAVLGIRPESLRTDGIARDGELALPLSAGATEVLGARTTLHTRWGGSALVLSGETSWGAAPTGLLEARVAPADLHFFDAENGRRLDADDTRMAA